MIVLATCDWTSTVRISALHANVDCILYSIVVLHTVQLVQLIQLLHAALIKSLSCKLLGRVLRPHMKLSYSDLHCDVIVSRIYI